MTKKDETTNKEESILDRIKSVSTLKETSVLSESKIYSEQDMIPMPIPIMNVAVSGSFDGGFVPGLTMWAGESKRFKTGFTLLMVKSYFDKYLDAVCLYYISEFGSPIKYFDTFGIPKDRVIISPVTDLEELKVDITNQLHKMKRNDRVIIVIDSIGNLASRKEVEDALKGSDKADMTRAKTAKSIFRIVTPHLMLKNIPLIVVNHSYKTIEMFSKDVVSGGTGSYYSSDNIYIVGRQQDAEGDGAKKVLNGYVFVINVDKSRYVKEKSKFFIEISFSDGINKWSGLLDLAVEGGFITKTKKKSLVYNLPDDPTDYLEEDTNNANFWNPLLTNKQFKEFVQRKYQLAENDILGS